MAPAMYSAGVGTMAAGPIPVTTQVPVTTYRTVTVDQGSYQRVWVPRLVTQRVPQTTYQARTVWMNQQQPACAPGAAFGGSMLPSAAPLGGSILPGATVPSTVLPGSILPSTTLPSSPLPMDGLPMGSPYGGSGIIESAPVDSTFGPVMPPSPGDGYGGVQGSVPMPPSTTSITRPMRSASVMGLSSGIYSDGIRNYDPAHVPAPRLSGMQTQSDFPQLPSHSGSRVIDDYAMDGHFDDWVDVEPSGGSRTASTRDTSVYEPSAYRSRTRTKSGLFSPVRPGTGIAKARHTSR